MKVKNIFLNVIIGLVAGIINGLFSAGGGMILVPAFEHILKMDEVEARATSVFCILPMAIVSSFFYFNKDFLDWSLSIKCAIGGTIGGLIGAKLLKKVSKKILKGAFIIFLIYFSMRLIFA